MYHYNNIDDVNNSDLGMHEDSVTCTLHTKVYYVVCMYTLSMYMCITLTHLTEHFLLLLLCAVFTKDCYNVVFTLLQLFFVHFR